MKISAKVDNRQGSHEVRLRTADREHSIEIPPGPSGFGSRANGGELLFLALASCYCNDIYREAARLEIEVQRVEVEVNGEFEGIGSAASNVRYRAKVTAKASKAQIRELMRHTDTVAEIQNTLRSVTPVELEHIDAQSLDEG